jgi:hypothetical protein
MGIPDRIRGRSLPTAIFRCEGIVRARLPGDCDIGDAIHNFRRAGGEGGINVWRLLANVISDFVNIGEMGAVEPINGDDL